jgi:hypothetical protein
MSVVYAITNNYGPAFPNCAVSLGAGTAPDPTATTVARTEPSALAGTVNTNTGRTTMATQTSLTPLTFDGPQSGSPALTNVTAANLTGYAVGSLQFYQFTGPYQSK